MSQIIVYRKPDHATFKLKQRRNGQWVEVAVNDIIRIQNQDYRVLEIKPNEVTLEKLIQEATDDKD